MTAYNLKCRSAFFGGVWKPCLLRVQDLASSQNPNTVKKSHHWATKVQGMSVHLNGAFMKWGCTVQEWVQYFPDDILSTFLFPPLLMKKKRTLQLWDIFLYSLIRSHWDCWLLIDKMYPGFPWEALFYSGSLSPRGWGGGALSIMTFAGRVPPQVVERIDLRP